MAFEYLKLQLVRLGVRYPIEGKNKNSNNVLYFVYNDKHFMLESHSDDTQLIEYQLQHNGPHIIHNKYSVPSNNWRKVLELIQT